MQALGKRSAPDILYNPTRPPAESLPTSVKPQQTAMAMSRRPRPSAPRRPNTWAHGEVPYDARLMRIVKQASGLQVR